MCFCLIALLFVSVHKMIFCLVFSNETEKCFGFIMMSFPLIADECLHFAMMVYLFR